MKRTKEKKDYIEILREQGFKWITRAAHGEVQAHYTKPVRMQNYWDSKGRREIEGRLFYDISWNDEPLYIGKERRK